MDLKKNKGNSFPICNGILSYGDQMVIPAVLTKKKLKGFHIGLLGISQIKGLTRSYFCWYGMGKEIENLVKLFKICELAAKAPHVKFNP